MRCEKGQYFLQKVICFCCLLKQENCVYETVVLPLDERAFEKTLTPIIQEYFEHGDTNEVSVRHMSFYFFIVGGKPVANEGIPTASYKCVYRDVGKECARRIPK